MKNKNKTIWANRFKGKTSKSFQRIGSSINVDKRLYKQDIIASIAHIQMLMKQKIINNIDGKINGKLKVKGDPFAPIMNGSLLVDDASANISLLGVDLNFNGELISILTISATK